MDPEPSPSRPRRPWAVPFAAVAAVVAFFGVSRYVLKPEVVGDAAVSLAATHGLLPAADPLTMGTEIFQWDPEVDTAAPVDLGKVSDPALVVGGKRYTRIVSPNRNFNNACLEIKRGELRYWVRK